MDIFLEERLEYHPDHVYEILWKRFTDLPAHLPNVESITHLSSHDHSELHQQTEHRWCADRAVVPGFARPFIKPNVFQWIGHAHWRHDARQVDFHFLSDVFKDLYECKGQFLVGPHAEDEQHTHIVIQARLDIFPERLPGVPRWLAGKVGNLIEDLLMDRIEPSLAALPHAVTQYASS